MLVAGAPATKPAHLVDPGEPVVLVVAPRFVGRGGHKLEAALDRFGIAVAGTVALDVGASTGGFTDCLLQRGAARVVAVDVGRNQLHERLRADARVDCREQTDVRALDPEGAGGPFPLVVADLAFISLTRVVPALLQSASPGADLVLLVKPQFEAAKVEVSRGRGVIRDPQVWRRALRDVAGALSDHGAAIMGAMVSPLRGADGNVEFLVHAAAPPGARPHAPVEPARRAPAPPVDAALDRVVDDAIAAVAAATGERAEPGNGAVQAP